MALELVDEMCERGLSFSMEALHSILYASSESCDFNLVSCIILRIYIYILFMYIVLLLPFQKEIVWFLLFLLSTNVINCDSLM